MITSRMNDGKFWSSFQYGRARKKNCVMRMINYSNDCVACAAVISHARIESHTDNFLVLRKRR